MNKNKISPARAVAIVGISAAAIECGKLAPSIALLKELAQIVGVKAADLLADDE